ncbi:energy-coupling factor transporter ATPase [Ethanoligenens harbinense]|uniref:ABC transporter ATP-binding protein n=1 Tax=Ethanoligenens harbinense (strain DSM 18485 / JCM 12961 / CGMCC 1.5033 / YUAN-3) TaxID=663278 RepID=E6U476_ETHHY|nr:ABC transporter related protein [Ethanoligenens harbinense YUAN-3]AVQ95702.1 energy-coupling factor transporter ATPase [Ethanoligenens harbinense YUAN-3]AYF38365.1 energy-coupling factor transporter ATPase [Ethanoligenens harbinense]AYF41110.1 energy-coupling factor transporter ATPase [Ethanoligenens harbinense]QCN91941.1 energy-coupling factor transporter ATPase [Ethanoligenens harbinense]
MEHILDIEHISYSYPIDEVTRVQALRDVSLRVPKGEFLAILGHNGSGKSTLAKHFNAILLPESGAVRAMGIDTRDEDRLYDIRRHVGMVFQNPDNQIVATIVEEDVAFALENMGIPTPEIRRRVDDALKTVGMYDYRKHAPHRLSGGQKQRVAIAGVLAMRPDCIVLDEPTAMLDPRGRKEVLSTLLDLHARGVTVVLITHFMDEAVQADRVVVMEHGGILLSGTPKEVFGNVTLLKSIGLDVPQAAELAWELDKCGLRLPDGILTVNELADALAGLLEGSRCPSSKPNN